MKFDRVPPIAKHLSVIYLLTRLGSNTVWMFLPLFFEQHISSLFLIGLLTSVAPAIPVLMDIPVGNLVQRAGEKMVIFIGLLMNLMPGLLYITGIPVFLVLGKVFEGIVKSLIWNGGWSISLKSSEQESEGESVSVFLLGANLATIIGPLIGGYLIASKGFQLTFALWVFGAWLSSLVFYLYIGLEGEKHFFESLEEIFHRQTYLDDYHHLKNNWDRLRFPLSLMFIYSVIFSFFWLAVPLLLERVGAGYELMGIIFGMAALPKLFQFAFGELSDIIGDLKLTAILAVLLIPIMAGMGYFEGIYVVGGLFLVARLLTTGFTPALHAFYDSRVPDELEGEMTGFMEFFKHSGNTLGPLLAGAASSIWSISASFYTASFVALLLFGMSSYGFLKN